MNFVTSKQWFRKKWLKSLQCRIISAFQNCATFENRKHFGKRFIVLGNPTTVTTTYTYLTKNWCSCVTITRRTCCDCHTKKRDGRSYVIPNDFRGKIDGIQSVRSTNWFQIKSSFIYVPEKTSGRRLLQQMIFHT